MSDSRGATVLDSALSGREAAGFVHVCRGDDPDGRYLTGLGFDAEVAVVRADGETHVRVPSGVEHPDVSGVSVRTDDRPAGQAAAAVLDAEGAGERTTVLAPRYLPYDAALHLQRAGYELESTTALTEARATKSDAELDAIEGVQRAARHALTHAATILADATTEEDLLVWDGAPLSTERLRRQVNAVLAAEGVDSAGNTNVAVGPASADETKGQNVAVELAPNRPIAVSVRPRGANGYFGALARTFVVDSDGGWDRRAHVACDAARDVALIEAKPGADAGFVGSEIRAETAAFGFSMADEVTRDVGEGIGLSVREAPKLDGDTELVAGNVLRIRAAVSNPDHGWVELADVIALGEDGPRVLGDTPTVLDPAGWE
ncbi:M24 family metallopeptidase [Haloferax namakaokahaiae]|uniref:M24 family metallopeptidase n=1 Tax=Haloferax namakaokahaiae TaxID=1748331 RepID=A0ABD5ZIC4_9EURY